MLRAHDDDFLDPREIRQADNEERRGARDRDQPGNGARRVLDAECGPAAAGRLALGAPGTSAQRARRRASSSAQSTKRASRSPNWIPAARAAFGSRLFAVMPGIVLTSRVTMRSPAHMRSVRDIPRQPSALWARTAMSCARRATSSGMRAGTISSLSPALYFAV